MDNYLQIRLNKRNILNYQVASIIIYLYVFLEADGA